MEQELNERGPINLVGHILFGKFPHGLIWQSYSNLVILTQFLSM